jgi:hypothetical protein
MSRIPLLLLWPVGLVLAIALFFASNIRGYYRFKEICARDAGVRVYQPLERNVGWTVGGGRMLDTALPVRYPEVAFVRYRNEKDGNWFDVYRVPKLKVGDDGFAQQPADLSKPVIYEYRWHHEVLNDELRMSATLYEVIDLRTSKNAATYTTFGYSKFDRDKTLLAAPSGVGCPEDFPQTDPKTGMYLPLKQDLAFSSMFIQK